MHDSTKVVSVNKFVSHTIDHIPWDCELLQLDRDGFRTKILLPVGP